MARTMNKTGKGMLSKRGTMISLLVLTIALLVTSITYAWFRNILEIDGFSGNTGNFKYTFVGFDGNGNTLFNYNTQQNQDELKNEEFVINSNSIIFQTDENGNVQNGEFYILVYKQSGSVDLDVSVRLNAQLEKLQLFDQDGTLTQVSTGESAEEYIGGFWYSVEQVTGAFGSSGINQQEAKNKFSQTPVKIDYFPNIRKEVRKASLDSNNFTCLRVQFGRKDEATSGSFNNKQIKIYAELCVAQKGGLPDAGLGNSYTVYTEADLKKYILQALPGDEIIVAADIVHNGDLIINRPLKLRIGSGSLTVRGNMRYTFMGQRDDFILDLTGGPLSILKMTDVDAGGYFYVELPNSSLVVYGRALGGSGKADITVENNVIVNAAYLDTGKDDSLAEQSSLGLYLSSVRMCDTDNNPKALYLTNCTKLTVGQHSSIGTVSVLSSSSDYSMHAIRVFILNHGTIEGINLKSMSYFSGEYENPRIFIHNYGIINKVKDSNYHILLPAWSRKYYPNVEGSSSASNTRIIWEDGSSEMNVKTDGSAADRFVDADIERNEKQTLIEKLDAEGTSILIHYLDASKLSGWPTNDDGTPVETTIQNLVAYYETINDPQKVIDFSSVTSLKIACYAAATEYALTSADYAYIRTNGENLQSIDLGEAVSKNNELPDNAFSGLTQLSKLVLSEKDSSWGGYLFYNTKIDEITLPYNLEKIDDNAFIVKGTDQFIKFIYVRNKADVLADENFGVPSLFTKLATSTKARPDVFLICGSEAARDILVAKVEQTYNKLNGKPEDNYFKEKVSGEPLASELMTISTIFVGADAQRIKDADGQDRYLVSLNSSFGTATFHTYLGKDDSGKTNFNAAAEKAEDSAHRFDFKSFWVGQEEYTITAYDDFAFFQIKVSDGTDTFELSQDLKTIGDGAFYSASLPKNVNLGGATYVGHAAIAKNSGVKNIAGLVVETVGYYACGGYSPAFINMPRLAVSYGYSFGLSSRMDIGLVQLASDSKATGNFARLVVYETNIWNTAIIIHTEHLSTVPTELIKLGRQTSYQTFAPAEYKDLLVAAEFTGTNSFQTLGSHTADTLGVLTYDGQDVTDDIFAVGNYLYCLNEDSSAYILIKCITAGTIDGSVWSKNGVFTVPAYTDEQGRTTTSARGSTFGYQTINNVQTMTFADEYRTIGDSFFGGSSYAYRKYVAHIDFNNVETIGRSAFYLSRSLITVSGQNVKSIGTNAFEQCSELRTVSFPNLTLGANANTFLSCPKLQTVVIGPQYETSHAFRNCPKLETVYINMSDADPSKTVKYVYLQGGSADTASNEILSVIVIGYEYSDAVASIYSMVTVDTDYRNIIYADWSEGEKISIQLADSTDSKYTYNYTLSTPTYMFSQSTDGLTIQLAFGLQNITGESYRIPDTLYAGAETVTTILGNETLKYFTTKVEGTQDKNMHVVAIEDNIYSGKIDVGQVIFPSGLTKIGKNAFANCTLGAVNINGAEKGLLIDDGAFNGAKMSSLTIENVISIGKEAFKGDVVNDSTLGDVKITGTKSGLLIDVGAFDSTKMSSLTIENVIFIGTEAFKGIMNRVYVEGGNYIDYPIDINLGNMLHTISANAFEGALLSSITTTHDEDSIVFLDIGEAAFKNVKSGVDGEVEVNFGHAVVNFAPYSFQNVKFSNLIAPNTIRVQANAFHKVDVSGVVDFSEGVPVEIAGAYDPQTIEPYGFYGTSSDRCQLGEIKLGRNCLLMGDYYAIDGKYPVVQDKQGYKGAFHYCDIQSLQFSLEVAQEPQAIAFVGCNFNEIRFNALTTIGINYGGIGRSDNSKSDDIYHVFVTHSGVPQNNGSWTNFMFVDCGRLGNVYFTNITQFAFKFRGGSKHEIALKDMPNLMTLTSGAFGGLTLIDDTIEFPDGLTIDGSVFYSTTVNCDLIFGDNTTIKGSEPFKDSTFNGDIYFGDNLNVSASYPFERSKFNGTVSFGSINFTNTSTGHGMFGNNASSGNATSGFGARVVLRSTCTEIPTRFFAFAKFGTIDLSQSSVVECGTAAFAHSEIGEIIGLEKIQVFGAHCFGEYNKKSYTRVTTVNKGLDISGATSIGEGAFINMTFKNAVTLSAIREIKASAFKGCTFEKMLTLGSAIGTSILPNAFANAKFLVDIDLDGVNSIGERAFMKAEFSSTLQLKNVTSIGSNAFSGAVINGDLVFGNRVSDGEEGYIYTGPAFAIGDDAFASLTVYGSDGVTVSETIAGAKILGAVWFVNVTDIGARAFKGAMIRDPMTIPGLEIGDSAFYGLAISAVTFTGNPVIGANAFKQSLISELTFKAGGEIQAEAFAEGTYVTINLGSVTLIGGSYNPEDGSYTGAFRGASIGRINFENSCIPLESTPQPIANGAFAGAKIEFLNFEGAARALVGNSADNSTDPAFVAGAYSPFYGADIERLNLNGVTSVGYGYFSNLEIGQVDTVTSDAIELQSWSLAGTTIKTGSLIFTGNVTMRGFATCGQIKIPSGNLEFNGSLVGAGGENQVNINGNMVINSLIAGGDYDAYKYAGLFGNKNIKSTITGNLTIKNSFACGIQHATVGGLILENVSSVPFYGFCNNTIRNYVNIECVKTINGYAFGATTFPSNAVLNMTHLTAFGGSRVFEGARNILAFIAPELQTIGADAIFKGNSVLAYVYLPKLATISGYKAFENCVSLKSIDLPALKSMVDQTFSGCSKLEIVVIGDQFSSWNNSNGGVDIFKGCTSLKTVVLQTPLVYNETTQKWSITGSFVFPSGAKLLVPIDLKDGYDNYFAVTGNTKLWGGSYPETRGLTQAQIGTIQFILEGNGVTYLAELLYGNKIEIVDIIDTANVMRNAAFTFPSTLSDGTTTYTVASISSDAMKSLQNTNVTTVVLPSTLEYINFSGLDTGSGIQAYQIADSTRFMTDANGVLYTADGKTLVLYPAGKTGDVIIPNTVEYVGAYAFAGNQSITTITFQGSVTIADSAFANCYGLAKIAFEAGVSNVRFIGRNTVNDCNLANLKIQVVTGTTVVVLYDTEIFQLIEEVTAPEEPQT